MMYGGNLKLIRENCSVGAELFHTDGRADTTKEILRTRHKNAFPSSSFHTLLFRNFTDLYSG